MHLFYPIAKHVGIGQVKSELDAGAIPSARISLAGRLPMVRDDEIPQKGGADGCSNQDTSMLS